MIANPGEAPRFVVESLSSDTSDNTDRASDNVSWDDRFTIVGASNYVKAIAVSGGILYIDVIFSCIGDAPATYIAKWDGSTWSVLASGMNSRFYAPGGLR